MRSTSLARRRDLVIFLAPHFQQADYWANQWGYRPDDWTYVSYDDRRRGLGLRPKRVFVCGTVPLESAVAYEEVCAYWQAIEPDCEFIDAQDIDTEVLG